MVPSDGAGYPKQNAHGRSSVIRNNLVGRLAQAEARTLLFQVLRTTRFPDLDGIAVSDGTVADDRDPSSRRDRIVLLWRKGECRLQNRNPPVFLQFGGKRLKTYTGPQNNDSADRGVAVCPFIATFPTLRDITVSASAPTFPA